MKFKHGEEPEEEQLVFTRDLPIQQIQRRRQQVARAFLRLRNRNGHEGKTRLAAQTVPSVPALG